MIRKVDHIAVAVHGLEERLAFWAEALGLEVGGLHTVETEGVKVAFLQAGETRIELLQPLGDDTPVGKFLAKRGEGLHHLTFEVSDLEAALGRLKERGIEALGSGVRIGADGRKVAFLHPKAAGGVLVELLQAPAAKRAPVDILPGQAVLLYLREPQEKLWGVLRRMDAAGVVLEGIDLGSFDDWVAQLERGEESVVGPSLMFVPMMRLERVLLDRSSGHLPSLAERFFRRTGRRPLDVLDAEHDARQASGDGGL